MLGLISSFEVDPYKLLHPLLVWILQYLPNTPSPTPNPNGGRCKGGFGRGRRGLNYTSDYNWCTAITRRMPLAARVVPFFVSCFLYSSLTFLASVNWIFAKVGLINWHFGRAARIRFSEVFNQFRSYPESEEYNFDF